MHGTRLYVRLLTISLRSQMQYRAAMVMQTVGHLLVTAIEFFGMWALFERFGQLKGWALAEVAVFYGMVGLSFSIADAASRGFDHVADAIKRGDFDRVLLRPRSTALQIAGQELTIKRVGRFAQALVIVLWGTGTLGVEWTPERVVMVVWTLVGGVCMFYGLVVVQATIAFWTTESLELMNVLTYGGVETAQYPLSIYRVWFRRFFTFVVPLACVSYFPVVLILGREDPLGSPVWFQASSPVLGVVFLGVALQLWRVGVRHYTSTGS